MRHARSSGLLGLAIALAITGGSASAEVMGTIRDLGQYGGSGPIFPFPVSPNGTRTGGGVGNYELVHTDGSTVELGSLGISGYFNFAGAYAVNDADTVVGSSRAGLRNDHAFVSYEGNADSPGRHIRDLGTLSGRNSAATAVNAAGTVVGQADTVDNGAHAFVVAAATYTSPDFADRYASRGYNPYGSDYYHNPDGTLVVRTPMTDLGTLGGSNNNSTALAINDKGRVVGASNIDSGATAHAFSYDNGKMTDLGTLPGLPNSVATAVDSRGRIVGFATDGRVDLYHAYSAWMMYTNSVIPMYGGVAHAFLYDNGKMTDLNDLLPKDSGWLLESAMTIDDAGQITGRGSYDGQERGYLLSLSSDSIQAAPVPEPTTLALFGLIAAGAWMKCKRSGGMLTSS